MSDLMLYGVLRMPYEMAMGDDISRIQFYNRVQEAATRLEKAEKRLAELESASTAPACTCPSGDGSLRWPCPVHPSSEVSEHGCHWRNCPHGADCVHASKPAPAGAAREVDIEAERPEFLAWHKTTGDGYPYDHYDGEANAAWNGWLAAIVASSWKRSAWSCAKCGKFEFRDQLHDAATPTTEKE